MDTVDRTMGQTLIYAYIFKTGDGGLTLGEKACKNQCCKQYYFFQGDFDQDVKLENIKAHFKLDDEYNKAVITLQIRLDMNLWKIKQVF